MLLSNPRSSPAPSSMRLSSPVNHWIPSRPNTPRLAERAYLSSETFISILSPYHLPYGTQAIQRPDTLQDFASVRVGANKTQIVYSCNLNFHTVVPYLDILIKNGLAEKLEGEHIRHSTQARGGETAATAPSGAGIGTRDKGE